VAGDERTNRVKYCLDQARRVRAMAASTSRLNHQVMMEVAASWERLARSVEGERSSDVLRALDRERAWRPRSLDEEAD
jgi:hypothetical protein